MRDPGTARRLPVVAIVGRPNVGKSTLFNRLAQKRAAITHDLPGVTRDRVYADTDWNGVSFTLVDTGGLLARPQQSMDRLVRAQVEKAVAEAAAVIFVVDAQVGVTAEDQEVAAWLRRQGKPTVLAANKAEGNPDLWPLYSLGMGDPYPVSALHGRGTGDLLDAVVACLPEQEAAEGYMEDDATYRLALVGRPNVGKSTLLNRLLGEERAIVSPQAGTTRDPVDAELLVEGKRVVLVDTAGVRRPSRVEEDLERLTVRRALQAISRADVAVLLLDAREGLTDQDKRLARYAEEQGRGLVLAVNKWDAVRKETGTLEAATAHLRTELPRMSYAPIVFISALTGQRVGQLIHEALRVADQHRQRVSTGLLNQVLHEAMDRVPPPTHRGRTVKVLYATQAATRPPTFVLFARHAEAMPDSYQRYLLGVLRDRFHLDATPLRLVLREEKESRAR